MQDESKEGGRGLGDEEEYIEGRRYSIPLRDENQDKKEWIILIGEEEIIVKDMIRC